jgi:hypothetical protein
MESSSVRAALSTAPPVRPLAPHPPLHPSPSLASRRQHWCSQALAYKGLRHPCPQAKLEQGRAHHLFCARVRPQMSIWVCEVRRRRGLAAAGREAGTEAHNTAIMYVGMYVKDVNV